MLFGLERDTWLLIVIALLLLFILNVLRDLVKVVRTGFAGLEGRLDDLDLSSEVANGIQEVQRRRLKTAEIEDEARGIL